MGVAAVATDGPPPRLASLADPPHKGEGKEEASGRGTGFTDNYALRGLLARRRPAGRSRNSGMAYSHAEATAQGGRLTLSWPLAVAAAVYLLLLLLGARLLNDADTYWQIALGRWMLAHHAVPQIDTFTFTLAGTHWISSQWLAQVLFAGAYALAGWAGVVVLAAAAIAVAFGLLTRFLFERLALTPALTLAVAGFVLAAPHMVARPHALALPVMVAWVAGLARALDQRRPPSFALLPLIALWANLHGSFTFGLALLAPVALEALVHAPAEKRIAVALRWALFGALALAAACITPYGPESILVTRRVLGLGRALALIGEWQPQSFATLSGFALCLLAGIGFALYRGLTLPPFRLLVLLGLIYLALSHSRNAEMLGLLAPLFVAAPLAPQLGRSDGLPGKIQLLPSLALMLTLALASLGFSFVANYQPRAAVTPAAAVAALKASGAKHVLNSYDFGGYLIFSGVKPFIDGRTELYGESFVLRHDRAVRLLDVGTFFDLLKQYDIDATLLAPDTPAVGLLDRLPGWKRVYSDGVAVLHVRTQPDVKPEVRP